MSIVKSKYSRIMLIMERKRITNAMRNMFVWLNLISFYLRPESIIHREDFAIQQ